MSSIATSASAQLPVPAASRRRAIFEIAMIFAVFLVHAGLQAPEVNEPYYLGKARHYWNPQWCGGDSFYRSGDSHAVFYWLCGWWTLLMPLPAVAIVGRVLTYGLLAVSWRRLSIALVSGAWWSVLSAGLLVTFGSRLSMAGEWIVGGFEAKGLAYAAVFLALEAVVRNRWLLAWALLGLATSLHVLVGGWAAVAAGLVALASRRDSERPSIGHMLASIGLGAIIALPGVWTALKVDRGLDQKIGARTLNPAIAGRAAEIQVFERLGHHLDPGHFFFQPSTVFQVLMPTELGYRFLALTLLWVGLCALLPADEGGRRWRRFVCGSLLIATTGMLIYLVTVRLLGNVTLAARLLRFYWFRLADAIVPAGAALAAIAYLAAARRRRPLLSTAWLAAVLVVVGVHLAWQSYTRTSNPIPPADRKIAYDESRYADWLDICRFVEATTPPQARFLTPAGSQTFKWYAGRAEVAVWKEMPQDAASIVVWRDLIRRIQETEGAHVGRLEQAQLLALALACRANYLVVRLEPGLDLPGDYLYRNGSFALYRVPR